MLKMRYIGSFIILTGWMIGFNGPLLAENPDNLPSLSDELEPDVSGQMVEPVSRTEEPPNIYNAESPFMDLKVGNSGRVTVPQNFGKPGVSSD